MIGAQPQRIDVNLAPTMHRTLASTDASTITGVDTPSTTRRTFTRADGLLQTGVTLLRLSATHPPLTKADASVATGVHTPSTVEFSGRTIGRQADRPPTKERLKAHVTVVATSDQATADRRIFGLPPSIARCDLCRIDDLPTGLRPVGRYSAYHRISEGTA